jgi:PIN domain nuclease of toxin-antitoxin system
MRVLIDSHALIWYVDQDNLLSLASHAAISDPANDLLLSAGSIWEIGIKVGLSKLVLTRPFSPWMNQAISDLHVTVLPLSVEYVDVQSNLPKHHGDPFDRLIVAQAIVERFSIISADAKLDAYGITRIW